MHALAQRIGSAGFLAAAIRIIIRWPVSFLPTLIGRLLIWAGRVTGLAFTALWGYSYLDIEKTVAA